jgi:hypothetical protein
MKEKCLKLGKTRYLLLADPRDSVANTTSDLRVGGSNPSGRANDSNSLRHSNLIFSPIVSTFVSTVVF